MLCCCAFELDPQSLMSRCPSPASTLSSARCVHVLSADQRENHKALWLVTGDQQCQQHSAMQDFAVPDLAIAASAFQGNKASCRDMETRKSTKVSSRSTHLSFLPSPIVIIILGIVAAGLCTDLPVMRLPGRGLRSPPARRHSWGFRQHGREAGCICRAKCCGDTPSNSSHSEQGQQPR